MSILLHHCEVDGRLVDVLVEGETISAVGTGFPVPHGAEILDAHGGTLLPGLHDHHIHLLALAAALRSVRVGPPDVHNRQQFDRALREADGQHEPGAWIRAVAYHERVAGRLDRWILDGVVPSNPVRVQHRSGGLWVLNSAALRRIGLDGGTAAPPGCELTVDGTPTGRLFRLDDWLRERLPPAEPPDLAAVGQLLLARGVTGVTDATPFNEAGPLQALAAAVRTGALVQEVTVMGAPLLDPATIPPELCAGPAKILMSDHQPPALDDLISSVRTARQTGRAVAIHCVTRVAAVLAIAALETAGARPGDRIEHGAVLPPEQRRAAADLDLTVVTQPNMVAERGDDYLAEVDPDDLAHLWPCASLLADGVTTAGGTDAPFGAANPWVLIRAATLRRSPSGRVLGAHERLDERRALELMLGTSDDPGRPRRVAPGTTADLCLLAGSLGDALADPGDVSVQAVITRSTLHAIGG